MHPHLWPGGLRGPLLPHLSQAAACWPLGPGPGPARRTSSRPSAARLPGVPGRPDLRQWRPCSYRNPVRPGGGPLARRSASCPEPCVPRQPPGAPERPCTARRRRLRLSTAASSKQASGAACRGSGRVARAAVPSAPESRSRLFSVEKTGNFARLRQAAPDTPRLTGRRHPLSRRKWKQLPISRAGGVPQLVCYGQQERPISSTASSCTTRYRRLIPSACADKKPDPSYL